MKKTMMKSRILTMFLAFAVALSFMGFEFAAVPAYAEDEDTAMTVNLGTDALEDPENEGPVKSLVWFGKYNSEPVKYFVLDADSADYGVDDSVFLLSTKALFARALGTNNSWEESTLREYLNDYYLTTSFTEQENAAVAESVKTEGETSYDDLSYDYEYVPLEGDKVFLLSGDEYLNSVYGAFDERIPEFLADSSDYAFLPTRSATPDQPTNVMGYAGFWYPCSVISEENCQIAPAMNIDSSKVFMTVANDYDKTALAAPAATESNEWKFTLEDESQTVDVTKCSVEGNKASVTYDYSGEGATQLSLLVENADGEIVEYGKVADIDAGTATFDLPEGFDPANDSACVFAEQVNEAGYTDYAGTPVELDIEEQPEGPVDFFDPDVWPDWATTADELDGTEVLIDVRPQATYVQGQLPGSINCPVSNPYTPAQQEAIAKVYDDNKDAESIVIVCVSGNMLAKNALSALQAAGKDMSIVTYLQGGANGVKDKWVTNDGAVSEKAPVIGETKARTMTTVIDMSSAERYGKGDVVEVWVPVPQTDELQTIKNEKLVAEKAEKAEFTVSEDHGNKMAYIKWGEAVEPADRIATITFDAERKEVSRPDLEENLEAGYPAEALAYLGEESEYVKVKAPIVQNTAAEITEGKVGPLEKARAIYDWCIANLERIDNGETLVNVDGESKTFKVVGCGYGDTVQILTDLEEFGRAGGHCTDINSVFVALCRAAGIPAREMFGIRMGDDATGGQHCWAQFYLPGTGWVYADPGDVLKFGVKGNKSNLNMTVEEVEAARKNEETAKYTAMYWGGVDNNRIQLSTGRDVTLEPAQNDGVRNTFGYPYAEVNGKQEDDNGEYIDCTVGKDFVYKISCTEIKAPVVKKAQPITLKAKTVKLKAKTLKKKALKVKISKALTIKNAQGTKSYKITKVSKAKFKKYFKINAKSGKITVKKKLKKGTYKVTIQVTAKGNANYKAGSKKKVVTFKVK